MKYEIFPPPNHKCLWNKMLYTNLTFQLGKGTRGCLSSELQVWQSYGVKLPYVCMTSWEVICVHSLPLLCSETSRISHLLWIFMLSYARLEGWRQWSLHATLISISVMPIKRIFLLDRDGWGKRLESVLQKLLQATFLVTSWKFYCSDKKYWRPKQLFLVMAIDPWSTEHIPAWIFI
jgi:hypothetical protein